MVWLNILLSPSLPNNVNFLKTLSAPDKLPLENSRGHAFCSCSIVRRKSYEPTSKSPRSSGCHPNTIGNLRRRFLKKGLEATLNDKPMGPTAPVKITGSIETQLALIACSDLLAGRARWMLRLLASRTVELGLLEGMSYESVRQTLKK